MNKNQIGIRIAIAFPVYIAFFIFSIFILAIEQIILFVAKGLVEWTLWMSRSEKTLFRIVKHVRAWATVGPSAS